MRRWFAVAALACTLPLGAMAQSAKKALPITTGPTAQRMDAPESNNQLEQYAHSPMVQSIGHKMGLTTDQASRYFEDFNSGVVILVILFFFFKIVPAKFRAKREHLSKDLVDARETSAEADRRLKAIEQRLNALGSDVEALRVQAQAGMQAEEARTKAAMEEERQRIVRSAEVEIEAAQASAQRGLRKFAAELAIERAAAKVQVSPDDERVLMDDFLTSLASERGMRGRN